jgi:hypothetical protein
MKTKIKTPRFSRLILDTLNPFRKLPPSVPPGRGFLALIKS